MIKLNCKKVVTSRGISNYLTHLRQYGITRFQVHRLMNKNLRTVSLDTLEKLCLALNCTPNDLLEWTPDSAGQDMELTSLRLLKPKPQGNLGVMLSRLPYDKLNEIAKIVSEAQKQQ